MKPRFFLDTTMMVRIRSLLGILLCAVVVAHESIGQPRLPRPTNGGEITRVALRDSSLRIAVRNIDITRYPLINVVFDVMTMDNRSVIGLDRADVSITENGREQEVISLSMITRANRVPVDFVFVIDQTASMVDKIEGVKQNVDEFTTRLAAKGIDYRLGLIVFDDNVAQRRWLTDDIVEFKSWIDGITAGGGGDEKENALEALRAVTGMNFRSSANRCIVLVTDAPYHQYGEHGWGRTIYTAESMGALLTKRDIRTFCIVNTAIPGYSQIARSTGGQLFDINQPFAEILNNFALTMTSLYAATYQTDIERIPDSIWVEVEIPGVVRSAKKAFAVLEVGRKLVVDNIHFATNRYSIDVTSTRELEYLIRLLRARPTLKLKIEGHTDNVGDHESNVRLSQQRAEAVRRYMIRAGISSDRLFTIGYGELRPTASNDTDEGRRLNRRTEFIILSR